MFLKKALAVGILSAPLLAMTGCGGDNAASGTDTSSKTAAFTLALTDGPVDSATAVVIEITGVSIKPKDGELIEVAFDTPKSIDVLQLQDGVVTDLINGLALEAGEYVWVELHINAVADGVMDSYVEFEDGTSVELNMPGASKNGLRIARQFTLAEGEDSTFTIDFDLRKSLIRRAQHEPVELRPDMRMVPNRRAGRLHGELDATLVAEMCADASVEAGAVYVYSGTDATPTDVNGSEADPIASALVKLTDDGEYRYRLGFLEAGDYTVAYTCDAASDNPDEVNELSFAVLEPVTIAAREEHEHPFPPSAPHKMWDKSVCDRLLSGAIDDTETEEMTEETEGEADAETTASLPPHLVSWCENGERDWHPRPGRGDENEQPMPPAEDPEHPERPQPPTDKPERPLPEDGEESDDEMSEEDEEDEVEEEETEETDTTEI